MSRELARRGHDVLLVAPDQHDRSNYDTPARVERYGRLFSVPANGSRAPLTLSPWAARRALGALKRFRADVVHYHEPFARCSPGRAFAPTRVRPLPPFIEAADGPALRLSGRCCDTWPPTWTPRRR